MGENPFRLMICGATAGVAVDLGLYPLDTIKTRLQSKQGFQAAGAFRNIYRGMGSVAIGSAPGAAMFFTTYGTTKRILGADNSVVHAIAASVGEVAACAVRVPTELIKQRAQASKSHSLSSISREIWQSHGVAGFYRGFAITIIREIPFAILQYPLWEALKKKAADMSGNKSCSPLEGAACGSIAGAVSAGLTTPLDLAKTRIMLSKETTAPTVLNTLKTVYQAGGVAALFSGVTPRVTWMALGGFVFFGAYESAIAVSYWLV